MKKLELFKKLKPYQYVIIAFAIVINVFIIASSCLPATQSTQESSWVVTTSATVINTIKEDTINDTNIGDYTAFIRKFVGHFSLFFVSGVLTTLSFKYLYYDNRQNYRVFIVFSCISGIFLANLTEFIQFFVPGRSGEITDIRIDSLGYLVAAVITLLVIYLLIINRKRKTKVIK